MRDGSGEDNNVAPSVYSHVSRPGSHRYKNAKKGLPFNLMLIGESGLGRSTFLNTLCERSVVPTTNVPNPEQAHIAEPMQFKHYSVDMDEDGMKIILNIIDTPGFGNGTDNETCFNQIQEYLETQFDEVLGEENRIKRNPKFKDSRVHAILYFINPTGHSLREIDIELMRRLGNRANIIPVVARSDSLTPRELVLFKQRIMDDITAHNILVFNFPNSEEDDDEDEETVEENSELRAMMPFAVVGCEEVVNEDGRPVRVRNYPWGVVEVDNDEHSDFDRLRYVLLNSHIGDLRDRTQNDIYELYRTEKLSGNTVAGAASDNSSAHQPIMAARSHPVVA
ncbi:Cell division control protein 11 [Coemansia sp. RSA 353]|nr:Cell division control protein 11 [Coemansia sp. RSA 921]KAJ2137499.1 Cell division control protein 11 [Coemansia sp. RSA 788]KAJ2141394.1 Cell division control protein 11 [Coemansia sp. RSA 637]KAJ2165803.1 Cell division control protein 11 [Coemansia sp. RSA 562]KAJ2174701.1 Cell division control protein 11 [Coemansia sp. RSA 560]KAJ2179865.1 Cell division control protein 11 [Coemansia sp. RSA 551]KAJ2187613.1 Cell division control protein 11 [Coemansia sp. RSA 532]KAJ2195983.1 Cell divis